MFALGLLDPLSALAELAVAKVIPTASPSPTSHGRHGTRIILQKRLATLVGASVKDRDP